MFSGYPGRDCLLALRVCHYCIFCYLGGKKNMVRYGGGHALLRLVMIAVVESEMICNEALHSNPPR